MSFQFPTATNSAMGVNPYMPQQITAYSMPTINTIMGGIPCAQTYAPNSTGYGGSGYGQPSPQGNLQQAVGLLQNVMSLMGQLAGSLGMGGATNGWGGTPSMMNNDGFNNAWAPNTASGMGGWPSNGGASWQQGGCMPPAAPTHFHYDTGGGYNRNTGYGPQPQYGPQVQYPPTYPNNTYPPVYGPSKPVIVNDDPFNGNNDPFNGNDNDPFSDNSDPFSDNSDPFTNNADSSNNNGNDPFGNDTDPFNSDSGTNGAGNDADPFNSDDTEFNTDNNADNDTDTSTDTTDDIVITDTASKNSYPLTGSGKAFTIKGNQGANKFDVVDLKKSSVTIENFDADDSIKLDVDAIDNLKLEVLYPDTNKVKIADPYGNKIVVTIPEDKDLTWLKQRLIGADGKALVAGGSNDTDGTEANWLPDGYTGDHFIQDPKEARGVVTASSKDGPPEGKNNTVIQFDVYRHKGKDNRPNYNLTGNQNIFNAVIKKDIGDFAYNVTAKNSKLNLFVGNDDSIYIPDFDASKLVPVKDADGKIVLTAEGYTQVSAQFFDKASGNVYKITMDGSASDTSIASKMQASFKKAPPPIVPYGK